MAEISMSPEQIRAAVALLMEARRSGRPLDGLPPSCRPATVADGHAIQDAVVAALGAAVGGWKVIAPEDGPLAGEVMRGAILAAQIAPTPARFAADRFRLRGIEGEIAFHFLRDLPGRAEPYAPGEVAEAVAALPAIEIVDSRYADFRAVSMEERVADSLISGGFVAGAPVADWRGVDLARLRVRLVIDGAVVLEQEGSHPAGDPFRPAVALVNALRSAGGVRAGQIVTTGSCTGLVFAEPGQSVRVTFETLGTAEAGFEV